MKELEKSFDFAPIRGTLNELALSEYFEEF